MSIQSQIERIQLNRDIIRAKMVDAGQASLNDDFDTLTENLTVYPIDNSLSNMSENPVQNKVINTALNNKQPKRLETPLKIGITERTTVEDALTAIKGFHYDSYADEKTSLVDSDKFPMTDSSSQINKTTRFSTIKSVLKTYFDTLYNKLTAGDGIDIDNNAISTERMTAEEIADLDIVTPGQPSGLVYDFRGTEMVVGKVIEADGTEKVLYQKTVDCGNMPNATNKSVAHGISNFGKCISMTGYIDTNEAFLPLPYVHKSANMDIALGVDSTNIILGTNTDRSGWTGYVTLLYTKTS